MSLRQFISVMRARWWVVALLLGLTVAGTLGLSWVWPRTWTAQASVVVEFRPDPVSAYVFGGGASPAFMATQVDIVRSERVAQRVVRNLGLDRHAALREQWRGETGGEGAIETWLAGLFQRQMDVVPSRESGVITVRYRAGDPRFAATLANAFVQAYMDTVLELRVDPARRYSGFFDARTREAREALERAQTRLSAYQREAGIVASDERVDVETSRLNELSSQLTALQAVAADASSRQVQAQGAQADRLQEVLNHPLVAQLKVEIGRGEARLKELDTRLGERHPQVIELRAQLEELRSRLEAETRKLTGGVGVNLSIQRQREAQLRTELDAQRGKLLRLKTVRDEASVLQREVESAQRAYDALQQRLLQTSLESQTTQSHVNLLTAAAVPSQPSSPRIWFNTLWAVFLGTLVAVGAALTLEMHDRRVRSAADAARVLRLPVIGVLRRPRRSSASQRALAGVPRRLLSAPGRSGAA